MADYQIKMNIILLFTDYKLELRLYLFAILKYSKLQVLESDMDLYFIIQWFSQILNVEIFHCDDVTLDHISYFLLYEYERIWYHINILFLWEEHLGCFLKRSVTYIP